MPRPKKTTTEDSLSIDKKDIKTENTQKKSSSSSVHIFVDKANNLFEIFHDTRDKRKLCLNHPITFAPVTRYCASVSSVDWVVYRQQDDDMQPEIDPDSPVSRAINNPNRDDTRADFMGDIVLDLMVYGESFVYVDQPKTTTDRKIVPINNQNLTDLVVIEHERVEVKYNNNSGQKIGYKISVSNSRSTVLRLDQMIHIKYPWIYKDGSVSPFMAAEDAMAMYSFQYEARKRILGNSGIPPGILVVTPADGNDPIPDEVMEAIRSDMEAGTIDGMKNGNVVVMGGIPLKVEYKQTKAEFNNIFNPEIRDNAVREIYSCFDYPELLAGGSGTSATYENQKEARKYFWQDGVIPVYLNVIQRAFVSFFGVDVRPVLDNVPALMDIRRDQMSAYNGIEWLTINEKRAANGYAPVEFGDKIIINGEVLEDIVLIPPMSDDNEEKKIVDDILGDIERKCGH